MKPKAPASSVENITGPTKQLSPELKELQGSFKIEGIEIPDERVLEYEAEFQRSKKSGQARADIERAIRRVSES
jgi:hypothetical protein